MADSFDKQLAVADVYAYALFELARGADAIEDVRSELDELVKLERSQPDFATFLSSSALPADRRAAGLEKLFRGRLSDLTLNTLLVMNRHERSGLLKALHRQYVRRQEDHANQVEVTAVSAVELSADEQRRVADTAARISGKTPLVEYQVDPKILGGLVLQIGDLRYDNSVRRQLAQVVDRLHARSERGLPIGVSD